MWLSTWPRAGIPQYAQHPSEAAAEAHAKWLVDSNTSRHATAYHLTDLTDDEEQ